MAEIKIAQDGASATISVDGKPLAGAVTKIAVSMEAGSMPVVTLDLAAFKNALELSDARLKIGGIEAPESVERAILAHLSEKYAPKGDRITVNKLVASGDLPADGGMIGGASIQIGDHAETRKSLRLERFVPLPVCASFGVDLAAGPDMTACTVVGSLPTAEEMKPAIRSVVQSVAADLLKLPVREMTDTKPAPAGLTRTATDGERNGRMTWVPGARA
jgi:hypothetical protein